MGASGYLLKRATAEEILRAVDEVHRGGAYGAGDRAPDEDACGFHCTVS